MLLIVRGTDGGGGLWFVQPPWSPVATKVASVRGQLSSIVDYFFLLDLTFSDTIVQVDVEIF